MVVRVGGPRNLKIFEFLSKTMYKIYDFLLNFPDFLFFPLLFLGFAVLPI
jgi:hypothetical protein